MVMNSFGNKNFMQPMGRLSMHSKCLDFFSFRFRGGRGGGGIFFILPLFPTCSLQVPIRFRMCSARLFPLAPQILVEIERVFCDDQLSTLSKFHGLLMCILFFRDFGTNVQFLTINSEFSRDVHILLVCSLASQNGHWLLNWSLKP